MRGYLEMRVSKFNPSSREPPRGLRDSSDDDARPMLSNAAAELDDVKRAW